MCARKPIEHKKEGKEQKPHGHAPKEVTTPLTNKVVDILKMVCSVRRYTNVTQQGKNPRQYQKTQPDSGKRNMGLDLLGFKQKVVFRGSARETRMGSCQNTSAAERGLMRNGVEPKTGLGDYITIPKSPTSDNVHMCESREPQRQLKEKTALRQSGSFLRGTVPTLS
jgi:hypothetical protein